MKYEVIWQPTAVENVTAAYLAALAEGRGSAVAAAVARIGHLLSREPMEQSESREGAERVLIESPLTIGFEVAETERRVYVLSARYYQPHRR